MPKKRSKSSKGKARSTVGRSDLADAVSEDSSGPDADAEGLIYNDVDRFYLAEDENLAKTLSKKRLAKPKRRDESEIFGLDSDLAESDDDGGGGGGAEAEPADGDVRRWGKKKKAFYGGNPNDAAAAAAAGGAGAADADDSDMEENKAEEREARLLQIKQLEQMDEDDFFDAFQPPTPAANNLKPTDACNASGAPTSSAAPAADDEESSVKLDVSRLSKKERRELFRKESPEFSGIAADFSARLGEAVSLLRPIVALIDDGTIPRGPAATFVRTKYQIILYYCTTICVYVLFKSRRAALKFHPLPGRLVQFRQMLDQLRTIDDVVMPQVRSIVRKISSGSSIEDLVIAEKRKAKTSVAGPTKKKLRILTAAAAAADDGSGDGAEAEATHAVAELTADERIALEVYDALKSRSRKKQVEEESDDDGNKEGESSAEPSSSAAAAAFVVGGDGDDERRGITYQMSKNKGLAPKRSKLQRNPRVKHRHKFEKAKVRRKGQVREVRTESSKYGGELSGINARVRKGIKLH